MENAMHAREFFGLNKDATPAEKSEPAFRLSCAEGIRSRKECPDYGTEKCTLCNAYGKKIKEE